MLLPDLNLQDLNFPKVSIVTVTKNAESLIELTIESVLNQDYPNIEYIVVDGDSKDGTQNIIKKHLKFINRYVCESDFGIYDAMNKGAKLASGGWIIYMNAGDRFYSPSSLSQIADAFNSDADVILAGIVEIFVDNLETRIFHKFPTPLEKIWYQMPTSHQATLVRLKDQLDYQFDTSYKWCADHDLMARMYRDGKKFLYLDTLLSVFDCSSDNGHRDPELYILERWRLSQGLAPLHWRLARYGSEWFHCKIWGKFVNFIKIFLPKPMILSLRRLRGTAGINGKTDAFF